MDKRILLVFIFFTFFTLLLLVGLFLILKTKSDNLTDDNDQVALTQGVVNEDDIGYSIESFTSDFIGRVFSASEFNLRFTLTNKSVEPYITNVGLNGCEVVDTNGTIYFVGAMYEKQFEKAVLPGESVLVIVDNVRIFLDTGNCQIKDSPNNATQICNYNQQGKCECLDVAVKDLYSCNLAVSTDGSQAGNGWGIQENTFKLNSQ